MPWTASKMLSNSDRAVRGSNTTGTLCVSTLTAFSRRSARWAAIRPTCSGNSTRYGVPVVAFHRLAVARHRRGAQRAVAAPVLAREVTRIGENVPSRVVVEPSALGVGDPRIAGERRVLGALGNLDLERRIQFRDIGGVHPQ